MEIFDDFDIDGKGFLKKDQFSEAYFDIFKEKGMNHKI